MNKKLVFFDLDGTIINNPSSENRFICFLARNGLIGIKQTWELFMFLCKWTSHFKYEVFVKNKAYLTNLPVKDIAKLATKFTYRCLLPHVRPKIKRCIDQHRNVGDFIVLLTGAPDFIANIFAKHLAIDELQAAQFARYNATGTEGEGEDDLFSNEPPRQHPYAAEKLKIALEVCARHQIRIEETIAYGNSIHDYALLDECGTPIAVTPDRKLRQIAQNKRWEIIEL